jgi:hypothetical protein
VIHLATVFQQHREGRLRVREIDLPDLLSLAGFYASTHVWLLLTL